MKLYLLLVMFLTSACANQSALNWDDLNYKNVPIAKPKNIQKLERTLNE